MWEQQVIYQPPTPVEAQPSHFWCCFGFFVYFFLANGLWLAETPPIKRGFFSSAVRWHTSPAAITCFLCIFRKKRDVPFIWRSIAAAAAAAAFLSAAIAQGKFLLLFWFFFLIFFVAVKKTTTKATPFIHVIFSLPLLLFSPFCSFLLSD